MDTARTVDEQGIIRTQDCAGGDLVCRRKGYGMWSRRHTVLGGNGYVNELPAGRLLRDAKLYEIGAGTSEVRRMVIGRNIQQGVLPSEAFDEFVQSSTISRRRICKKLAGTLSHQEIIKWVIQKPVDAGPSHASRSERLSMLGWPSSS